jgi:hypothetical protein
MKGVTSRKTLYVPELPKGFIYLTETHRVVGIGEKIDEKVMRRIATSGNE